MDLAGIVVGSLVLLFGRKLFWMFVGIVGFLVGFDLASLHLIEQSRLVIYAVAAMVGLVGFLVALFVQRMAFGIAGFLAGGYAVTTLFIRLGWILPINYEMVFLISGAIGALVALLLTDMGLIALSSLIGSVLIANALWLNSPWNLVVVITLTLFGVYIQRLFLTRKIPS